ncbi:MAG: bifunctional folylpolyglutamate synthase/dihydrofolate synthase [Anaerolineales bacterium]|nr:bifunctional folylpolyglutamate synthase/dihydrofolate synthase [Anaerolineales bacterium]
MQPNSNDYNSALTYLFDFINYEKKPVENYHESKIDPTRPGRLLGMIGNPQDQYPTIHIAGTKGKGSVAMMCASILRAAGLRVGLYTSPHLRDFRERFRILTPDDDDGRIAEQEFADLIQAIKPSVAEFPGITWYEVITAVAFWHFARQQVDIAVIEVGMGGRLDATNVVTPLVSVITRLSLDHTELLGDTLSQIAYEKGGIIKPGVPVVVAPQEPEALARLHLIAQERFAHMTRVGTDWRYISDPDKTSNPRQHLKITHSAEPTFIPQDTSFAIPLLGEFQLENSAIALAAIAAIHPRFPQLKTDTIRAGLASVRWDGRLQIIQQSTYTPTIVVDSAHNPDSAAILVTALQTNFTYRRLWLIFGTPGYKAIDEMMTLLFPLADEIYVSRAVHPRAAEPDELAKIASDLGFLVTAVADTTTAINTVFPQAHPDDLICATGSIIFIGELLNQWDNLKDQLIAQRGEQDAV